MPTNPNFDRVARIYRWAEYMSLGRLLERTREHFLSTISDRSSALVLGDGDGRFLARLLHLNLHLKALAIDSSAAMLQILSQRCAFATDRVQTHLGSALEANTTPATDLIVTHFFLDCFAQSEVDALTQKLASQVPSGTLWLLSDFALPHRPVLRPLGALYIRSLYLAFRILTGLQVTQLPDPQTALSRAGFERIAHHHKLFGLIYTEIWRRQ